MTELEFLKQESGLTDEEWKSMEAVAGSAKILSAVKKAMGLSEQALKDKVTAENERLALEKRYQEEMVPELRKAATDSINAQGELARVRAQLAKAKEYGVVPEDPTAPVAGTGDPAPPRAPGSPSAPAFDHADFARRQSGAIIALNDLNAEHFKLFGAPLGNSQELVDMVQREHTLGRRDFTLQKAWEQKFDVPTKRAELAKAEQQKVIDAAVASEKKKWAEANGSNPNLTTGKPSRFSGIKPSDGSAKTEPWKASHSSRERNNDWRTKAVSKVREAMAS